MRVTLLLSDSAQEAGGKVHALGLGWNVCGSPTPPMGVVVFIEVAWDETNRNIEFRLELVDADGHPVTAPGPFGDQPLVIEGQTQAGRPPGIPPGSDITIPLVLNIGPLPLAASQRYEWRVQIDGRSRAEWTRSFYVVPPPPTGGFGPAAT